MDNSYADDDLGQLMKSDSMENQPFKIASKSEPELNESALQVDTEGKIVENDLKK